MYIYFYNIVNLIQQQIDNSIAFFYIRIRSIISHGITQFFLINKHFTTHIVTKYKLKTKYRFRFVLNT